MVKHSSSMAHWHISRMSLSNRTFAILLFISLLLVIGHMVLNRDTITLRRDRINVVANTVNNSNRINKIMFLRKCEDEADMNLYLKCRRRLILRHCGEVCNTTPEMDENDNTHVKGMDDKRLGTGELKPGNYAKLTFKRKHFDCKLLFDSDVHDLPAPPFMTKPFKTIPDLLKKDYTYNERVVVNSWYIENDFPTNRAGGVSSDQDKGYPWYGMVVWYLYHLYCTYYGTWYRDGKWTKEEIDKKKNAAQSKNWHHVGGAYGEDETRVLYETLNLHRKEIEGKIVLVVGSITPWVEAVLLSIGAKHITTLDYNKIRPSHPQVDAILPKELSDIFTFNKHRSMFDIAVSYSSIEHSGLVRYGDAPHPWGDLVTLGKIWCYIKDGGLAFIGIPTNKTDSIYYNAHRVYGPLMLSHLFTNWKLKIASWPYESPTGKQITFVLQKDISA